MSNRTLVRVREVMTTQFDRVDGLMTVREALQTMKHAQTKTLIINKRHEDDAFGMLVFADIAREVLAKDRSADRVNVYEIMEKPVLCVDPEMDIRYCARLLDRYGMFSAPVVDNGEVVGIISLTGMVLHGITSSDD
jgi:predicted transcriptional regulator